MATDYDAPRRNAEDDPADDSLEALQADRASSAKAGLVDVDEALLPSLLRGAASSDLPAPEQIAAIRTPTLLLAWDGDPGHPVSTAERLHELIPDSALHVARTPAELRTWSDRTADFLR